MASAEIESLLRFYTGRKLISKKDIKEFSDMYQAVRVLVIKPKQTASKEGE